MGLSTIQNKKSRSDFSKRLLKFNHQLLPIRTLTGSYQMYWLLYKSATEFL